ncbi:MAG TPA: cytochrome c3 family protein, partial [Gemmatimonadales bacterium]|nr:cytochrome c3 family protein [Gemmatimonadales bacterium]
AEYFPKDNTAFDCATCHTLDSAGVTMATGSFAAMCAPCHRDQIEQKGMPVFQMPGVDYDLLGDYHVAIGEWPRDANLDLEQDMSPWTRLLLATDPRAAALMQQLDGVDLYYLDRDATEARAAGRLVWEFKALVDDLAREGRSAMLTRLERAEPGLSARDVAALVDQIPVDSAVSRPGWQRALIAAEQHWFPDLARDVTRHGRGLAVPTDPIEDTAEAAADSDSTGWNLTDQYAVAYRATGHADETYRRWLDLTQRPGDTSSALRGIYQSLSDPEGPGACMKCHHVRDAGGVKRIAWTSALQRQVPKRGLADLTPFAHGAHLATPCATCHTAQDDYTFAPIAKRTCMTCHDGRHVSQACLICHRYHARSFVSRAPIPAPEAPAPDSAAASPTDSAAANSTP